ncbi:MAG: fibronectin type III domain-containing protein [Solirubrobacteraceae bacterium]
MRTLRTRIWKKTVTVRILFVLAVSATAVAAWAQQAWAAEKPEVTHITTESIGATIATLRAEVEPNGEATTYRFEYGRSESYGFTVPAGSGSLEAGSSPVSVAVNISGLTANTLYHYRVVAINSTGTTVSQDQTLSTFGIASFVADVIGSDDKPDVEAGSHPYAVTTSLDLATFAHNDAGGYLKGMKLRFPVGLSGEARAIPTCPQRLLPPENDQFLGFSRCPADTQVGMLTLHLAGEEAAVVTIPLYNLVPESGVPVQFGVYAIAFPLVINATVDAEHGYALSVDLPGVSDLLPITGISFTLWGVPADPEHDGERGACAPSPIGGEPSGKSCPSGATLRPLLTLASVCETPPQFALEVDSWAQPDVVVNAIATANGVDGSQLSGCDTLDFTPTVDVMPEVTTTEAPSGFDMKIALPHNESPSGRTEAPMKQIRVELPQDLSINVSGANGLQTCSSEQIRLGNSQQPSCPPSSEIASVRVDTPMLSAPLVGSIYLGVPPDPFEGQLAGYLVASGEGVVVKAPVHINADPATGRLSVTVEELPQVPFAKLRLDFRGGPRAPLATSSECGVQQAQAQLTPYSTPDRVVTRRSEYTIDSNCTANLSPSFLAGGVSADAGENSGFLLRLSREDDEQQLSSFSAILPKGVLARLGGVPRCSDAQAASGACPVDAQVGSVTIAAGAGSAPYYLHGAIFLTGPYEDAPFGLAIVIPAVAGPFDLGTVVVRGRLSLDRHDAQLSLQTDRLPSILKGVPLRIRSLAIEIDRPNFMFNPTNCATQSVTANVLSEDSAAIVSTPFAVRGCAHLPFSVKVTASVLAKVSRRGGAGLNITIRQPSGTLANMDRVRVVLPPQLSARLNAIRHSCPQRIFVRDPASCPMRSRVGSVTALTGVLGSPLSGPIYLLSNGTKTRPAIAMVMQGEGVVLELTGELRIFHGRVSFTIRNVPDAPISALAVALPGGPGSVLGDNTLAGVRGSLCGRKMMLEASITGQNRASVALSPRVAVSGCRK